MGSEIPSVIPMISYEDGIAAMERHGSEVRRLAENSRR
jgi:hypothetical protein